MPSNFPSRRLSGAEPSSFSPTRKMKRSMAENPELSRRGDDQYENFAEDIILVGPTSCTLADDGSGALEV